MVWCVCGDGQEGMKDRQMEHGRLKDIEMERSCGRTRNVMWTGSQSKSQSVSWTVENKQTHKQSFD